MLVSVGRDSVTPALAWRLPGTESRYHFPAGLILFIYFFSHTFLMLFHVLHISNIFPGMQPKEGTDEDLQNAPMLPASMIVA